MVGIPGIGQNNEGSRLGDKLNTRERQNIPSQTGSNKIQIKKNKHGNEDQFQIKKSFDRQQNISPGSRNNSQNGLRESRIGKIQQLRPNQPDIRSQDKSETLKKVNQSPLTENKSGYKNQSCASKAAGRGRFH